MNDSALPSCPHCGSQQLVSSQNHRKVFINHNGESIPLLTVNFRLQHPVIEQTAITYSCSCNWSGTGNSR